MDSLQKQVTILSNKVDTLYQVVDQLSGKMSDALSQCRLTPIQETKDTQGIEGVGRSSARQSLFNGAMEHKDVLVDGNELDAHRQSGDKQLSAEIQIQRLMAQLTAAYNRIAALEEQLLAQRIH